MTGGKIDLSINHHQKQKMRKHMPNYETLQRINRARKLLKDALILLEDLDLEQSTGIPGKGIDCPPRPEAPPHRKNRDHL
jgi:hypothetical protein